MNQNPKPEIDDLTLSMSSVHLSDTKTEIAQLQAKIESLTLRLSEQTAPPPPKPTLPKPQVFSGDKPTFPAWKYAMKEKILRDVPDAGRDRVNYVVAFLVGDPAIHAFNFVSADRNADCTYLNLLEHMENRYGDPHAQAKAMDQLNRLVMRGNNFEEFVTEFEGLAGKAEVDQWPDLAKSELFENKLGPELRDLMVPILVSTDNLKGRFHEYVNTVRQAHTQQTAALRSRTRKQTTGETMLRTPPTSQRTTTTAPDPDAMDWTRSYRHDTRPTAQVISEKEFRVRKNKGVCTTCGNEGHFAKRCRYRISRDQPRFAVGARAFSTTTGAPREVMHVEEGKE